jgi:Flp pilus assembly protein TadD
VNWAKKLDPLSVDPWITASLLAPNANAAVKPLEHAVSMEPRNYALHYLLGFAYLRAARAADGNAELLKAYLLDPRDPLVASALPQQVVPSQSARPPRSG